MKTLLMKLALLVFLSSTGQSGEIRDTSLRPYDEVLKEFKDRVASDDLPTDCAERGLTTMQIWTQSGGKVKHHRFNIETVATPDPVEPDPALDPQTNLEIDPNMVTDPPAKVDPTTVASSDIHPAGVSPSAAETGSPADPTAADKESDPPSTSEVASAPAASSSRKRGSSSA